MKTKFHLTSSLPAQSHGFAPVYRDTAVPRIAKKLRQPEKKF